MDDAIAKEHIDPLKSGIKHLDGTEGKTMLHPRTKLVLSGAALLLSLSKRVGKAPTFFKLEMVGPADAARQWPGDD